MAGGASTGGLDLTDEPIKHADGTSDVVVTNIRAFSSAARSTPDVFNNAPVSFALPLEDECLAETCATLEIPEVTVAQGIVGAGRAFFAAAVAAGHEGIVAKRLTRRV